jgi:hypothetical protein
MKMKRRNMLAIVTVVSIDAIVGSAEAGVCDLIVAIYSHMTDDRKQTIANAIGDALIGVSRKIASVVKGPAEHAQPRGGVPTLTVWIRPHATKGLSFAAQLNDLDGDGKPEAVHAGTAPHHTHPSMHAHIAAIVRKSDVWLRAHQM